MKKIITLLLFCIPFLLLGQIKINIGGGINNNTGRYSSRELGKLFGVTASTMGAENWHYKISLQYTEYIWQGFNSSTGDWDRTRYQYLNVVPQVEYIPRHAIGFVGGIYSGLFLAERFKVIGSKGWTKRQETGNTRWIDPGVMFGTNLYFGPVSFGFHYMRSFFLIKNGEFDDFLNFIPMEKNSALQFKLGYFFSVGKDDREE